MFLITHFLKETVKDSEGLDGGLLELPNIQQIIMQDNSPDGGIIVWSTFN